VSNQGSRLPSEWHRTQSSAGLIAPGCLIRIEELIYAVVRDTVSSLSGKQVRVACLSSSKTMKKIARNDQMLNLITSLSKYTADKMTMQVTITQTKKMKLNS